MKLGKVLAGSLFVASSLLAGSHSAHWGYTGHEGPSKWGDLDPKYEMCKLGSSQSPINIENKDVVATSGLEKIEFNYRSAASKVLNNGHTVQVNMLGGSSIKVDGMEFNLKQFHFHTPSENNIDGKSFPLEAHFVHASKDGKLAVVALMFEDGAENATLKKIWGKMPVVAGESNACGLPHEGIDAMLPKKRDYYRFNGSLTTPPCSEGVRWFVLKDYSTISKAQVKEFLDAVHHENNRPVQPINARKVMK